MSITITDDVQVWVKVTDSAYGQYHIMRDKYYHLDSITKDDTTASGWYVKFHYKDETYQYCLCMSLVTFYSDEQRLLE